MRSAQPSNPTRHRSIQKQSNPTSQEDVNAGSGKDVTCLFHPMVWSPALEA